MTKSNIWPMVAAAHPSSRVARKRSTADVFRTSSDVRRLPFSTLWTVRPDIEAADLAFRRSLKAAEAILDVEDVLEKLMLVEFANWHNTSNFYKPPVKRWMGKTKLDTAILHQENDPDFEY